MKHVVAFLFAVTLHGAVVYDRDPVGVNGSGLGYFELFDGVAIDTSWNLFFSGSDGFVSVMVSAVGTHGFLGMGVAPGPDMINSHGMIWDINGNNYTGLAGYSLGTLPETARLLTLYEWTGGPADDHRNYQAIVSVPIWGHYAANVIESIPHHDRYETRRYEIAIHTPEPSAWQMIMLGGLIPLWHVRKRLPLASRQRRA